MKETDFKAEKKIPTEKKLAFQLCFRCWGISPTRNAFKLTFLFFQLQLFSPCNVLNNWSWMKRNVSFNPPWYRSSIVYCVLRGVPMISKLLNNFSYDPIEALVKHFFEFLPTLFIKLTSNDINPRIFCIEHTKKFFFFHSEDFFEVVHISVAPK